MAGVISFLWRSFFLIFLPLVVNSRVPLKVLTEESWQDMLVGEWMIEFFAPWCPACRQLEPVWKEFAGWSEDLGIQVGSVDVTTNPGLSGRFAITALPTIFHVKDGVFRQYRGSKRKDELISFIEDVKWKEIEPIPSWKSPQSIQMTSLAYFFKFSMFLRNVHNDLVELGIPYWGSYIIFGLATIFLGAILGLLIVYIIDHLCPAKKPLQEPELQGVSKFEKKAGKKVCGDECSGRISSMPEDSEKIKKTKKGVVIRDVKEDVAEDEMYNIPEGDEEKDSSSGSEDEEGEGSGPSEDEEKDGSSGSEVKDGSSASEDEEKDGSTESDVKDGSSAIDDEDQDVVNEKHSPAKSSEVIFFKGCIDDMEKETVRKRVSKSTGKEE